MNSTTFVTCLFDCYIDNTEHFFNYYFSGCLRTLCIDEPFIIYCEPKLVAKVLGIRLALGYKEKTKVIPMTMEELYFHKHKKIIHDNLFKAKNLTKRENAEIEIVWYSKSEFILSSIKTNPFTTTHFAWIDINLLSKHPSNSMNYIQPGIYPLIKKIAAAPHDGLAITTIGCCAKELYNNFSLYWSKPRFYFSAAFYTIDIETAFFILPKIIAKTEALVLMGWVRGDEMVFPYITDEYEDKFTFLLGDYQDTLHNYFSLDTNEKAISGRILKEYVAAGKAAQYKRILEQYRERDTLHKFNYEEAFKAIEAPPTDS